MGIKFAGSRMKVINHVGICTGKGKMIFADGVVEGKIIAPKHNDHKGREFDLFMQVDGTDRPMLEYSTEEKNKFSHRGLAVENLLAILRKENK
jgi:XTP/dITP diphosphohydrolase